MGTTGRALHYVFKAVDRKLTAHFYRNVLGMKVLRHEEFSEGCEAACNGYVHASLLLILIIHKSV